MTDTVKVPVFDGTAGDVNLVVQQEGYSDLVRFWFDSYKKGVGTCWHIDDPRAAKKLRKLLKPLADQA